MEEVDDKTFFEKMTSIISFIALLLLVFSALKLFGYYIFFNLNIFSYIDISELLPQSLFSIFHLIFFSFISLVITDQTRHIWLENLKGGGQIGRMLFLSNFKKIHWWIVITILIMLPIYLYYLVITDVSSKLTSVALHLTIIINVTLFSQLWLYLRKIKLKILYSILPISLAFLISGFLEGNIEYNKLLNSTLKTSYIIFESKGKETEVRSTSSYYFVGRTKSYIFFFDNNTKLTTVYPTSLVSKMVIQNQ
jgi:hypothetical protein